MISKACKYGIRATIFIVSKAHENVKPGVKEIAKQIDAPEAFTAKILQSLNKHGVITSIKGPYGGFICTPSQLNLPVIEIIKAIDGLSIFRECGLGLKECSDAHPCPMHHKYAKSRDALKKSFQETTIGTLAGNLKEGIVYVNNV